MLGVLLIGFGLCLQYNDDIIAFLLKMSNDVKVEKVTIENNSYATSYDYKFVQLNKDLKPSSKQDIINIYYTVLNSGMNSLTFYCPKEYKECIDDVDYVSNDQGLLSNINNFVPVYNGFKNIETEFDSLGRVDITITHSYNNDEIDILRKTVTNIINENITTDMTDELKIKAIHDYIINNTKYDKDRSDNKVAKYKSDTAYGALVEHYAICGGYADSMKLFLEELKIPNFKISSENHIWNLVYLDNVWYHLDLTWDDPVTSTGDDVLEYDYFLITTEDLLKRETDQHIFDKKVYKEAT